MNDLGAAGRDDGKGVVPPRRKRIALPEFCLTCGYSEVPGERFNDHECEDFRRLTPEQRAMNKARSTAEMRRRIAR